MATNSSPAPEAGRAEVDEGTLVKRVVAAVRDARAGGLGSVLDAVPGEMVTAGAGSEERHEVHCPRRWPKRVRMRLVGACPC